MNARHLPEDVSIVIPAPNPTGSLHLGHALNLTVQDIFARWYRAQGARVFWEGATDHGGSSTEIVMHRTLQSQSKIPRDVPVSSQQTLLASLMSQSVCAISRQFQDLHLTLDSTDMRSMADAQVQREFDGYIRTLHERGYLYWAQKMDDWCYERAQSIPSYDSTPGTAKIQLYSFKYSIGKADIAIDHTEPAHLFDEVGVIVPAESDLAKFEGQYAINPLGAPVPIYAGPVRRPSSLTPAHDATSFRFCFERGLKVSCCIDSRGVLDTGAFKGKEFRAASTDILTLTHRRGSLMDWREESRNVQLCRGTGYRVYKRLVPGLFVRSSILLQGAVEVVMSGRVRIYPRRYTEWLLPWMGDLIQRGEEADWRVTREHLCGNHVAADVIKTAAKSGDNEPIPDYRMDMMISCALWAFAANGKYLHEGNGSQKSNTSLCVTGLDLLFFWIATIVALSGGLGKEVPFSEVIVHPLITDKSGQKMSKSMGNTIEVEEIIRRHGTPALRMYLLSCLDETKDYLSVDPDALVAISKPLEDAKHPRQNRHRSAARVTVNEISEDLSKIEKSLSARDVGSAARVVLSWLESIDRWESLPSELNERVRAVSEVFLTEPLTL